MLDRGLGGTPDTAWLWDLMRLIRTQSDTTMSNVSTKDGGGYASANKRTHATHRKHAPTTHTYLYKHTPYHARMIVHLLTYFVLPFASFMTFHRIVGRILITFHSTNLHYLQVHVGAVVC